MTVAPIQNRAFLNVGNHVTLKATGTTQVGGQTSGAVTVQAGGKLTGAALLIGGVSSTTARPDYLSGVTVDGTGATAEFTTAALGQVNGWDGVTGAQTTTTTYLKIQNNGQMTVGAGAGATTSSLRIGTAYRGEASVLSGGQLTTGGSIAVGDLGTARGTGSLLVSGAGSKVTTTTGDVSVGLGTGAGTFQVQAGATADVAGKLIVGGTGTMTVGATVTSTGQFLVLTGGKTTIGATGTINANGGGNNSGTITIGGGGKIKAGAFGAGQFTNEGFMKGAPPEDSSLLEVDGDFTQTTAGELDIRLSNATGIAASDDLFAAAGGGMAGNVALDGSLNVSSNYTPTPWLLNGTPGDSFTIVSADGTVTGRFDPVTGLTLPDLTVLNQSAPSGTGYRWNVIYETHDVKLRVEQYVLTTVTLTSSAPTSYYGQSVTFTATVSGSPTSGAVTFLDGTTTLGTGYLMGGTATFSSSSLAIGSHSITAKFGGDATHGASTSAPLTQVVQAVATTTTVSSSASATYWGDTVTFTASVNGTTGTPAGGTIEFRDSGVLLSSVAASYGSASYSTSSLGLGSHSITATYVADPNDPTYAGSASAAVAVAVGQAATTTSMSAYVDPSPSQSYASLSASVSSMAGTPSGTMTFEDNGVILGTVTLDDWGYASFFVDNLASGSHVFTAFYTPNSLRYSASNS